MSADTNFTEINPSATNTEADTAYQADSFVTGGAATNAFWSSPTANKFFIQASRMYSALARMMVGKGYSPVDGTTPFNAAGTPSSAVTALATVLANIVTLADLIVAYSIGGFGTGSYVKFGPALGGLTIMWGKYNPVTAPTSGTSVSFPTTFPTGPSMVVLSPIGYNASWSISLLSVVSTTASAFTFALSGSGLSAGGGLGVGYIAIGN